MAELRQLVLDFVFKIYITISTITSILDPILSCPVISCFVTLPIPVVWSQNITNKSWLVCVKSEKCAFLVTLRPLGSIRWWKFELLHYINLHIVLWVAREWNSDRHSGRWTIKLTDKQLDRLFKVDKQSDWQTQSLTDKHIFQILI